MMINKIKKILKIEKNTTTLTTEEKTNKKKKRFSLLLKTAMIDPDDLNQNKRQLSKSSSFLQLQSFTTTPLKRSRSMFGQLYSNDKNVVSVTTEDSIPSAILDYYAASENIIHTAAVSISSVYSTINTVADGNDLLLAIDYYEKGELDQAYYYWKLSAESDSLLGIFFYGLALRHGWGCRKSPALAVRFLQKAAEYPVLDLQSGINHFISADKIESIVSSIYELGDFFWHGWEVPKSVSTATYYFKVASSMGNTDAMNDLAFCYKHGHGVEKDDMKAAQLYRVAETEGNGLVDNSWIWQEQYNDIEITT